VFFQLSRIGLFGTKKPISNLKNLSCRKYSFQKLSQLSQGNDVLNATHSNIDAFLWSDICGSSTLLNTPILNKESLFPP
jgi:hypothetical protein